MSDTPEVSTGSALRCIRDALEHSRKECPYHGADFERAGFSYGEPRCESCRQPWRVMRAFRALETLEAQA